MAYELPNFTGNTGGIEALLVGGSRQTPIFMGAILFFLYVAIAGAGFFIQERKTGHGNLSMWGAIAGLIVSTGAFFLLLYDGIVSLEIVVILMIVTILFAFFFLISTRE